MIWRHGYPPWIAIATRGRQGEGVRDAPSTATSRASQKSRGGATVTGITAHEKGGRKDHRCPFPIGWLIDFWANYNDLITTSP